MSLRYIFVIAALFSAFSLPSSARVPRKRQKSIVILYENDVHCAINGYSKMAGLRDAIRDTAWCEVVSSGDYLQGGTPGALSHGQYIADIMHEMHYAAITIGNHEFDYGYPRMTELLGEIDAPTTCTNLIDLATGQLVYKPYILRQIGDKTLAFIGALTPTTKQTEAIGFYDKDGHQTLDLCPEDIYQRVQQSVDAARKEGADYVIVLSHLGEDDNFCHIDSHSLVEATTGIDVVLDGHTHSVVPQLYLSNKAGKPVIVTQTGTQFANVGKLLITKDGRFSTELIPTKSIDVDNARVLAVTDSVKALYKELVSQKVGTTQCNLTINNDKGRRIVRCSETNLGDLVTDAFRHLTGADISITNSGGIRTSLPVGEITSGDVITVLPFENYLEVAELTGQQIVDVLNECCSIYPAESGDFPQVSGLTFTLHIPSPTNGYDSNTVTDVCILDTLSGEYKPVDLARTYTIGTINYCITGGGLQDRLKHCNVIRQGLDLYSQALIRYITDYLHGTIGSEYDKPQGRIRIEN